MNRVRSAMYFSIACTLLAGCASQPAAVRPDAGGAERYAGTWVGTLNAGGVVLRIVFNVTVSNGTLAATMDSPDQGAKGIPVSRIETQDGAVTFEVKAAGAFYSGKLSADYGSIDGAWNQGGRSFPVLLMKTEGPFTLERPQEPKPPFPYAALEVKFAGKAAGVELAGTLTVPKGQGPFPSVVLVSGSGPQNRDEELMGHKPFAVIADYLARNGIAALRYDDRGIGGSKGDFAVATTLDLADDAEAAFSFLSGRPEVDPKCAGIAGHSEGGLIAPIVAARNPSVAFLVLLAGPGLPGDRLLVAQGEALAAASGANQDRIAWSRELNKKLYAIAMKQGDAEALAAEAKKAYVDGIESSGLLSPKEKEEALKNADLTVRQILTPWYRTFLALDPAAYLAKVRAPVLALNGTKDLQVPWEENLAAIKSALAAGGNTGSRTVELQGLNHLFQHARTGLPDEYGTITETFAPEALSLIAEWIRGR